MSDQTPAMSFRNYANDNFLQASSRFLFANGSAWLALQALPQAGYEFLHAPDGIKHALRNAMCASNAFLLATNEFVRALSALQCEICSPLRAIDDKFYAKYEYSQALCFAKYQPK